MTTIELAYADLLARERQAIEEAHSAQRRWEEASREYAQLCRAGVDTPADRQRFVSAFECFERTRATVDLIDNELHAYLRERRTGFGRLHWVC